MHKGGNYVKPTTLHHSTQNLLEELHVFVAPLMDGSFQLVQIGLFGSDGSTIIQNEEEFVVIIVVGFLKAVIS